MKTKNSLKVIPRAKNSAITRQIITALEYCRATRPVAIGMFILHKDKSVTRICESGGKSPFEMIGAAEFLKDYIKESFSFEDTE